MNILNIIHWIADGRIKNESVFINDDYGSLKIINERIYYLENDEAYELEFYQIIELVQNNTLFYREEDNYD